MAWVGSRKTLALISMLTACVTGAYLLHSLVTNLKSPYDEFAQNHHVVIEVPPAPKALYERNLMTTVNNIKSRGPHVTILVQPSLRRQRNAQELWINKWNQTEHAPFQFKQTCSCKLGNPVPGCHFTYYIGSSYRDDFEACSDIPTQTASVECLGKSMMKIVNNLIGPTGVVNGSSSDGHVGQRSGLNQLPVISERRPGFNVASPGRGDPLPTPPGTVLGLQRTPDSL